MQVADQQARTVAAIIPPYFDGGKLTYKSHSVS